jgi:pyruvate,water dikinase
VSATPIRLTSRLGDGDRATVGGKAVGLAALLRAGLAIPDTWMLPVGEDPAAARLRRLAALASRWAVRSSATVEDGAALSYAGIFRSELDVPAADLAAAIARVRASVYDDRVAAYREKAGVSASSVGMAVLLQPYCPPLRAGVWLGRGSAEGRLEWVSGSGDRLVSGAITPAWEEWSSAGYIGGSDPGVLESSGEAVGAACIAVQRTLGVPADLEFAITDSGLAWLQFRPVTTAPVTVPSPSVLVDGHVVQGTAASSGRTTGRALWLHDAADPRWEPGAVLLTDETDPDWVPLMAEAAALVTAEGGMLCHAAIVSRELGVPCVTGVGAAALERLASSGLLAVDGTAGTVSVLSGA